MYQNREPRKSRKVTTLELSLFICVLVTLATIIVLATLKDKPEEVCSSPTCLKTSLNILNSIDPAQNPCENYHAFICGEFLKKAHETLTPNPIIKQRQHLNQQVNALITSPTTLKDPKGLHLEKIFFQACMNFEDNTKNFLQLLSENGGWPALLGQFWDESKFNWIDFLAKSKQLGLLITGFFMFNTRNTKGVNDLCITRPEFPILEGWENQIYLNIMIDIAVELNVSRFIAEIEMTKVFQFQTELSQITIQNKQIFETIGELQKKYPRINWFYFIENITGNTNFTEKSLIIHNLSDYLLEFNSLLVKTPKRVQANYLIWKLVEYFSPFISKKISKKYNTISKIKETRYNFCLNFTKSNFKFVAESEYIKKHTTKSIKKTVEEMIDLIKEELIKLISNSNWIDEETKNVLTLKVKLMKTDIGGQDEIFAKNFDEFFHTRNLSFTSGNILDLIRQKTGHFYNSVFTSIGQDGITDRQKAIFDLNLHVNAYYSTDNLIRLLQSIFFSPNRPFYLNFGALGVLIAHEMAHGLDKKNSHFTFPWSNNTLENYDSVTECLVGQYENFGNNLNGTLALSENYADFVGVDLSYRAYQKWVEKYGNEPKISNLPFSANQLFWIQASSLSCYQKMPDFEEVDSEDHAISEFRVVAPVRNCEFFGKDFQCPVGAPMNPLKKCRIF